ncbi:MAG: UDP-N-acetylenolpyruvoylglucosamine reductase [Planctomycetes bacterium ADurb.Bin126]|nr:MAG: UDP-N-acetylenolpyruvoylglucosamine reductase [Planctomycetes bacterium ADurb.Bin126]HOD80642.1 UDP-N-acetylmuramate dehydrogenase [Phycisphaerae bacterium]HQL73912.1 UDP-N-acetylmuramate dehydrogenase [Phycisphaerae bacterium]
MTLFAGLEEIVSENEPMAPHTWFRLGGSARYFVRPRNVDELKEAVCRCRDNNVPMYVLGSGANLLVDDAGVKGAVIHLMQDDFREVAFTDVGVRAGAGADMGKLVLRCVREGKSGLECLTGIPGSVGGCVRMNAGGAFGDIGSSVESVTVMSEEGEVFTRFRNDLAFGYRSTNIASKFILAAEFRLADDDPHSILKQVKQIWIYKKNTQPLGYRNAGCVFKNPRGLSAGALIDRAGLKGRRVGGAVVSERHANFILVREGATASDVLKLINIIRETVYRKSEVYLELELEVW